MAGGCCKEVPGAADTQLPCVGASWQQLQLAQSMPGGGRSFPSQRNAACALIPGLRLQRAQRGPRLDAGTKHSLFFQ